MTAVSPFSPRITGQASFHSQNSFQNQTSKVGLVLLVIQFWRRLPGSETLSSWCFRFLRTYLPTITTTKLLRQSSMSNDENEENNNRFDDRDVPTESVTDVSHANDIEQPAPSLKTRTASMMEKDSDDIRNNMRQIHTILNYWFGKGPEDCQKTLWMITNERQEYRQQIDLEITQKFGEILEDLASSTLDWSKDSVYGMQGKVAAIIVLDQMSRHIHRCLREQKNIKPFNIPSQTELDNLAFSMAQQLVEEHDTELRAGMLAIPMMIFSLMPYRHSQQLEQLMFVQNQVEQMATMLSEKDAMLRRFRKATNRRLAVLQDEHRREGDPNKETFVDEDILETVPFQADLQKAPKHVVYEAIVNFLREQGFRPDVERPIVVSLSGGVDSMVIASILGHLRLSGWKLRIISVHIDYANRPESGNEADFVRRFCDTNGLEFQCRRIDEVTRGITARDEYEKYTREVRYQLYRDTVTGCHVSDPVGVLLGHHRGDLRENVLSNAHKGCGPLDLSGMTDISMNDGVLLFRPLLSLEKEYIFDYAHIYGVPYFKDTTPHWSTRGKLRNKLLPLLEEIYGEGSLNNLSNLAVESDLCRKLVYDVAFSPFMKQVQYYPMGISFATEPWKDQGHFFWKFILREVLHSVGIGMFSDKSVGTFLRRVHFARRQDGWLQCRKDVGVFLCADGTVYVLHPKSFPWSKSSRYDIAGKTLAFGEEHSVAFGPWKVSTDLLHNTSWTREQVRELLERKAMTSISDLMQGHLEYYLPVIESDAAADSLTPLVFTKFTKPSRPKSWKQADLKTQEILPLVNLDEDTLGDLVENPSIASSSRVLRVQLTLS